MTDRIYTAAEAKALRACATPGPWRTYGNAAHDGAPSDAWTIAHDGDTLAELHADDRPQHGDASDEEVAEAVEADADLMAAAPDLAASVAHYARRAERAEAELIEAHDRARDAEAERAAAEAAITAVWQAITTDDLPRLPGGDGLVVDAEAVGQRVAEAMAERDALRADVALWQRSAEAHRADVVESQKSRDFWRKCEARQRAAADLANADFVAASVGRAHLARQVEHMEGEVARLTAALTAQTARADGAEAEAMRVTQERDAMRAIIEGRTTPPTDAEIDAHFAARGEWLVREYTTAGMFSAFSVDDPARAKMEAARPSSERRWRRWWAIGATSIPCAWPVVTEVTP